MNLKFKYADESAEDYKRLLETCLEYGIPLSGEIDCCMETNGMISWIESSEWGFAICDDLNNGIMIVKNERYADINCYKNYKDIQKCIDKWD